MAPVPVVQQRENGKANTLHDRGAIRLRFARTKFENRPNTQPMAVDIASAESWRRACRPAQCIEDDAPEHRVTRVPTS